MAESLDWHVIEDLLYFLSVQFSRFGTFPPSSCGNIDGNNPKQRQAWLWVAVKPLDME